MAERPLRVLIADDEPLARQRIADLLAREPNVEVIAEVDSGRAAVETIRARKPDLVFLDVQMPGLTGLEVVSSVGAAEMPATIFVTAYNQHALQAFDLAAIDYLVKPFDDERFEQAFARARRMVELEERDRVHERLLAVLRNEVLPPAPVAAPPDAVSRGGYLERIAVESKGKVRFIPVDQVDYIAADGPYAEVVSAGKRHLIRQSMQSLEERLDPARFMRVHRSAIIQLDRIDTLFRGAGGDYEVQLKDGTKLRVSRSKREELEERLAR